jgi:hypothetical protein
MSTTITDTLVRAADLCSIERQAMITYDCMITLSADMQAYLEYEASRRGADIATVYVEELAAERRLREKALKIESKLNSLATTRQPDPRLFEIHEEYPF